MGIKALKTVTVEGTVYAVVSDGKPVYEHDDGTDAPFDAIGATATISARNGEAKNHRERAEAAEAQLKKFEGITDPVAARAALETVGNLDSKQLVDAGKVEQIKADHGKAIEQALTSKYEPIVAERDKLRTDLDNEVIGGAFARSAFIKDNMVVPGDMAQATFGKHFSRGENGQLVCKDVHGNVIHSKENPAMPASFDEALQTIVGSYPDKDRILKGAGGSGSGANPGGGAGGAGDKTMLLSEYNADPVGASVKLAEGYTVIDD